MKQKVYHFDETYDGTDILKKLSEVLKSYPLNEHTFSSIYNCGIEVVLNSITHAYPETFKRKDNNIFSIMIIEYRKHYFEIELLDYGATIPVTILNKLPSLGITQQDDSILNMAVGGQLGLSKHRGKGLPSLLLSLKDENITNLRIHTGFAFFEANSENVVFYEKKDLFLPGTKVSFTVKFIESEHEIKSTTISVIDSIGEYPFGRYRKDGNGSAEEFRDDYLIPALNKYDIVNVELDGAMGFAASFLDEAFAGLVKKGFDNDELLLKLNLISKKNLVIEQIKKYIKGC